MAITSITDEISDSNDPYFSGFPSSISGAIDKISTPGAIGLCSGAIGVALLGLGVATQTSTIYLIAMGIFRFGVAHELANRAFQNLDTPFARMTGLAVVGLSTYYMGLPKAFIYGMLVGTFSSLSTSTNSKPEPAAKPEKAEPKFRIHYSDLVPMGEAADKMKEIGKVISDIATGHNPFGLETPKGMLLYGPPGTGKTALTQAFAADLGATVINVTPDQIHGSLIGSSERKIKQIFDQARQLRQDEPTRPVVIFIDEIDTLGTRESLTTSAQAAVPAILQQIDGFEPMGDGIYIVGATNYIDHVDRALCDRLESIETKLPSRVERVRLLKSYIGEAPVGDIDFDQLAEQTKGSSCRDLKGLVNSAKRLAHLESTEGAITELSMEHFYPETSIR